MLPTSVPINMMTQAALGLTLSYLNQSDIIKTLTLSRQWKRKIKQQDRIWEAFYQTFYCMSIQDMIHPEKMNTEGWATLLNEVKTGLTCSSNQNIKYGYNDKRWEILY